MNWTEEQLAAVQKRRGKGVKCAPETPEQAMAVHIRPTAMNKLEALYSEYLEGQKQAGLIADYGYELMRLKVGDAQKGVDAWYTPDFLVIAKTGQVEFHETKGFQREAAGVRIKAAARQYPRFIFKKIKRSDGQWWVERI